MQRHFSSHHCRQFSLLASSILLSCFPFAHTAPVDHSYQLVWSDEFLSPDYSPPNPAYWATRLDPGRSSAATTS